MMEGMLVEISALFGPGWVTELAGASAPYVKTEGLVSHQSSYKNQPMNAYKWSNKLMSLSLSNQSIKNNKKIT